VTQQSTLDPDDLPGQDAPRQPIGHDIRSLGPSNSSDTGADMVGAGLIDDAEDASVDQLALDDTTDREGTGDRISAGKESHIRMGGDIAPDRIVGPAEAGVGVGLDEAEKALAGIPEDSDETP
jgi:hypothetical protein